MKTSRIGLGLALAMLLATSALAQKVTTDFSKDVDFRQYKTFMWIKEPKPANPLVRQRIIDNVNAALEAKGLKLVTADADLAIAGRGDANGAVARHLLRRLWRRLAVARWSRIGDDARQHLRSRHAGD
jgi:hypothetical protein